MNRLTGRGIVASITLLFVGIANSMLGGFGVAVTLPNPDDLRQKDAVLLVQPVGCHGPGASVMARAEGILNGKRLTIDMTPILLDPGDSQSKGPLYMLKRQWPEAGIWVVAITAKKDGMDAHALVKVAQYGKILTIDRPRAVSWNEAELLPDGKTKMVLFPFGDGAKVAATYVVWGDLKAAVDFTLRSMR